MLRDIPNKDVVVKLFTDIAPRYASRPGGYTRLLRVGYRQGDAAEVAQVELLGFEFDPKAKAAKDEKKAAGQAEERRRPAEGGGRPAARQADRPRRPRARRRRSRPRARRAPRPARVPAARRGPSGNK